MSLKAKILWATTLLAYLCFSFFVLQKYQGHEIFPLSSYRLFTTPQKGPTTDYALELYEIKGTTLERPTELFSYRPKILSSYLVYEQIQKLPLKSEKQKIKWLKSLKKRFFPQGQARLRLIKRTFDPRDYHLNDSLLEKSHESSEYKL